jgi:hypothetical protein
MMISSCVPSEPTQNIFVFLQQILFSLTVDSTVSFLLLALSIPIVLQRHYYPHAVKWRGLFYWFWIPFYSFHYVTPHYLESCLCSSMCSCSSSDTTNTLLPLPDLWAGLPSLDQKTKLFLFAMYSMTILDWNTVLSCQANLYRINCFIWIHVL